MRPDAILSRSNAGVIANLLYCLKRNVRCAVVGGTRTLQRLLEDVLHVQQGKAAQTPELLGFQSWREVMSFSRDPEGEHLRGLVNLVQEHGAEPMLSALARCEQNEINAQVVCSTAHRAKGREWKHVHLGCGFRTGLSPREQTYRGAQGGCSGSNQCRSPTALRWHHQSIARRKSSLRTSERDSAYDIRQTRPWVCERRTRLTRIKEV